jgi:hypothetical protein
MIAATIMAPIQPIIFSELSRILSIQNVCDLPTV